MAIPDFSLLKTNYLDYWRYPKPEDVKKFLGGDIKNDTDIGNTCTIRMSHAMNMSGVPIPKVWEGKFSRKSKSGNYHILRVINFWPWMESQFGKPDMDFVKESGKAFDRKKIQGMEGVIGFEIKFDDATGHFDLWYQKEFSHENPDGKEYFTRASRVSLWSTGTRWTEAEV
jgi:hypothetical protein